MKEGLLTLAALLPYLHWQSLHHPLPSRADLLVATGETENQTSHEILLYFTS